ncbi:hypothetical protein SLEP1_g50609 [Rubroshorea leprosula]|nr:hypothetical protein SLEP1_g50609 [Rubroshorea leprosula]
MSKPFKISLSVLVQHYCHEDVSRVLSGRVLKEPIHVSILICAAAVLWVERSTYAHLEGTCPHKIKNR